LYYLYESFWKGVLIYFTEKLFKFDFRKLLWKKIIAVGFSLWNNSRQVKGFSQKTGYTIWLKPVFLIY